MSGAVTDREVIYYAEGFAKAERGNPRYEITFDPDRGCANVYVNGVVAMGDDHLREALTRMLRHRHALWLRAPHRKD